MARKALVACAAFSLVVASACGGPDSGPPPSLDLSGTVRVDGIGQPGVLIEAFALLGTDRQNTTTFSQGTYEFYDLATGSRWEVSIIEGVPDNVVCTPSSPQTVSLPARDVDFDCTTPGSGGTGGGGGTGGAGGTCGQAADSTEADLAGDVMVSVNGVAVTGSDPAAVSEGDTVTVRVPVTAAARFVVVGYADTARSESIGGAGQATVGNETVELTFEARGASIGSFPSGVFPLRVVVENADGSRNVVYETQLPDCTSVEAVVETNGVFGTPTAAESCTPNCLDAASAP